jgi:hypothetical protein
LGDLSSKTHHHIHVYHTPTHQSNTGGVCSHSRANKGALAKQTSERAATPCHCANKPDLPVCAEERDPQFECIYIYAGCTRGLFARADSHLLAAPPYIHLIRLFICLPVRVAAHTSAQLATKCERNSDNEVALRSVRTQRARPREVSTARISQSYPLVVLQNS